MIRDAIVERKIEVSSQHLARIFRPVLGDGNRSILHHAVGNDFSLLQEILAMPGIEDYYESAEVKTPIFFSFSGMTPLRLALNTRDYNSFYALIDFMLDFQNDI
jgi:hypothetical protein